MSDHPELADRAEEWPVVGRRDLHRADFVMALREDRVTRPGGGDERDFGRWVLEHPGAVVVLAVDEDNRVLCLWQYRHPIGHRCVELPAGLIDAEGEDPLDVARRELREEAGLEAAEWTPLTSVWPSPGISAEVQHHYLATGLGRGRPRGLRAGARGGRHDRGLGALRRAARRGPGRAGSPTRRWSSPCSPRMRGGWCPRAAAAAGE